MMNQNEREIYMLLIQTGRVNEAREWAQKCEAKKKEEAKKNVEASTHGK